MLPAGEVRIYLACGVLVAAGGDRLEKHRLDGEMAVSGSRVELVARRAVSFAPN